MGEASVLCNACWPPPLGLPVPISSVCVSHSEIPNAPPIPNYSPVR